jgi:predicted dehydrogenase
MAISLTHFARQFRLFGDAIKNGRAPLVTGAEGYRALELVDAIYRSCREGRRVRLDGLTLSGHALNRQETLGAPHV